MGRKATSLLLRRSPAEVMRLAVTGLPAGMSTLAPLPATSLTTAKACGGAGWEFVIVRTPESLPPAVPAPGAAEIERVPHVSVPSIVLVPCTASVQVPAQ